MQIGKDVTRAVPGIQGSQIRFDVAAPEDVSIHRAIAFKRIGPIKADSDFTGGPHNGLFTQQTLPSDSSQKAACTR